MDGILRQYADQTWDLFEISVHAVKGSSAGVGAMTVSEVSRSGKCAVFIPSPNVTNNHQYKNAKVLADDGAALIVEESGIEELENVLSRLLSPASDGERESMGKKIVKFSVPDANKRILEDILKLVSKKK